MNKRLLLTTLCKYTIIISDVCSKYLCTSEKKCTISGGMFYGTHVTFGVRP